MKSRDSLDQIEQDYGANAGPEEKQHPVVLELIERVRLAEAVIDAAKGPDSTRRSVAAMDAYEAKYGEVDVTYTPDF